LFHKKWLILFLHLLTTPVWAQRIQLTWDPPNSPNLAYYGIYRSSHPDSTFTLITTVNFPAGTYIDGRIPSNAHYFWAVTAVDGTGRESGFSNIVDTTLVSGTRGRVTAGQIVLYTFEEKGGAGVRDVSGFGAPLNLVVSNQAAVKWIPGGLAVNSATMIATAGAAKKIIDACKASNAITIEAWIKPGNTTQNGPARIVSLSADPFTRNFTLSQGLTNTAPTLYSMRLRTTTTDIEGNPALNTPEGSLTTQLSHVVYTRDAIGTAKVYINDVLRASGASGGDLSSWNDSYTLLLANELTGDRPWL
jgi:hypothetical protein